MSDDDKPKGELVIRTIAMPKDTNPSGDIFGGWLMSQMDLGAGILAGKTAKARVVTVAMERMSFLQPVWSEIQLLRLGRTHRADFNDDSGGSLVQRNRLGKQMRVTRAVFTCVAVDEDGKPIPVQRNDS
jgi:acyl-CoA thioesterase YciA